MNFISRDTDYAVRALMFMANKKKGSINTVDEIVREERLPERFLRRILQRLAKDKVLISYKGKDGGFSLSKDPSRIKVTDIIGIFQGDVDFAKCLLKGRKCPNVVRCPFRKKLKEIADYVSKELKKVTIKSLCSR